ncbi:MAG TPA: ROK family protein, partial [Fodinibius sp.]|nr:ROK family protein [Fodinibius sp.]
RIVGIEHGFQGVAHMQAKGLVHIPGFGSGLVLGGRLYSGANCGAGEVGMLPYKDTIFEHYCSGMFFERTFDRSGKNVYEKALKGDAEARNMYESFGLHMGHALKAVLYAYDPQLIILGGAIRKAYPYFKEAMYAEMADFAYPKSLDALELKISVLEHAAVLGAAALPLDEQLVNNNSNL